MTDSLASQLGMSLVLADTRFCRDYTFWDAGEDLKPIAAFALMPYLCAYAIDSSQYLRRTVIDATGPLQRHKPFLVESRLRAKLFDDRKHEFPEVMDRAGAVATLCSEGFYRSHFAWLQELKRRVVSDLGLFTLSGNLLCTTHVAFLNMGMDESSASGWHPKLPSRVTRETAEGIGRYARTVLDLLGEPVDNVIRLSRDASPRLTSTDVRSEQFYGSMPIRMGPRRDAIAIVLTSLLSAANAMRLLVPMLCVDNQACEMKAQYVTLFHLTSCLQNLLGAKSVDGQLSPGARERLQGLLLELPELTQGRRMLRNVLMHYGIDNTAAKGLNDGFPMLGLVEVYLNGLSNEELRRETRSGLERAASVLSGLLPPGFAS